jgi:hypothetical protein
VRHEGGAKVLERLATGGVIEVAVAIDNVFDGALVTAWIASM